MQASLVIVDPHRMVREGLRGILASQRGIEVVGEAADGPQALDVARLKRPDVVLLESQLPKLAGVEVVRRLRIEQPGTRCIVLASQPSAGQVKLALLAGAAGFVPKAAPATELLEAIRCARAGRCYLAPALADEVVVALTAKGAAGVAPGSGLSVREREVLQLIAEGLSTKEIATELGISIKTAQTHRAKLMGKVGVHKVSGLVRFAIREGIVAA
jgi:DNA-binding NarL/FixJ family response regulator